MTHPDDLLVALEDGTIASGDRADLERHLATCARCREELTLATAARAALASVPDAEAPPGIGDPAIRRAAQSRTGTPRWQRWGGVAAGIAAAVVLLALVVPRIGSKAERPAAAGAAAEASAASPTVEHPATSIETQDANYDAQTVAGIAGAYRGKQVRYAADAAGAGDASAPAAEATGGLFDAARGCLDRASSGAGGDLVRLIRARYEGTPAYIGVYLVGPAAGQPADSVRVLVVPIGSCTTILSSAAAKL